MNNLDLQTKRLFKQAYGVTPPIDVRPAIVTKIQANQLEIAPGFNALMIKRALQIALAATLVLDAIALYFFISELISSGISTYLKQAWSGLADYRYLLWPALEQAMPWLALCLWLLATLSFILILFYKKKLTHNNSLI